MLALALTLPSITVVSFTYRLLALLLCGSYDAVSCYKKIYLSSQGEAPPSGFPNGGRR